jgi:hypothetical protein
MGTMHNLDIHTPRNTWGAAEEVEDVRPEREMKVGKRKRAAGNPLSADGPEVLFLLPKVEDNQT